MGGSGGGTFANGEPCRVSAVAAIEDAVVSTGSAAEMPPGWATLAARAWSDRAFGDFWQHCLVAEGVLELATDAVLSLWDYAAVQLLVEEAGGRCTTFAGSAPEPGNSFLSTNGLVHETALGLLSV